MKFSTIFPVALAAVSLSAGETHAIGPKTESQKKEDRFFKCLLAMQQSDANEDSRLSEAEFHTMTNHLEVLLFGADVYEEPLDNSFYQAVVKASKPPNGETKIDTFGAGANVRIERLEVFSLSLRLEGFALKLLSNLSYYYMHHFAAL